jgi:hypothetical protein
MPKNTTMFAEVRAKEEAERIARVAAVQRRIAQEQDEK